MANNNSNSKKEYKYISGNSLIYVLGFIIVLFLCSNLYRKYQRNLLDKEEESKDTIKYSKCPDYWTVMENGTCRNTHNIGKCGLETDYDFNDPMFAEEKYGDHTKCVWSKMCNTSWEGLNNLC